MLKSVSIGQPASAKLAGSFFTTGPIPEARPTTRRKRRLLLSNYDIGIAVPSKALQLGLDFSETLPELFAGTEMGEDALRVLNEYITLHATIRADVAAELPHLRSTANWAARLP